MKKPKRKTNSYRNTESVFVKNLSTGDIIIQHRTNNAKNAASVTKVFYAASLAKMITDEEVQDELIEVRPSQVQAEGTNVLKDILREGAKVQLTTMTLCNLMVKYSCNASTDVLFERYFSDPNRTAALMKEFNLEHSRLYNEQGEWVNEWSVIDLAKVFEDLYTSPDKFGMSGELVRQSLKDSRNIYYLFDQLGISIEGSKTGTVYTDNGVQVNNVGVVETDDKQYVCGAMVTGGEINEAVTRIREIGKQIFNDLK